MPYAHQKVWVEEFKRGFLKQVVDSEWELQAVHGNGITFIAYDKDLKTPMQITLSVHIAELISEDDK